MKRFVGYLISKTPRAKKVAPTITQPKQLKKTMKKMSEKYQLQFNDHIKLYNYCKRLKLKYACSAFDIKS